MASTARTRRPRSNPRPAPARQAAAPVRPQLRTDLFAIGLALVGVLLALALYRPGSAGPFGRLLADLIRLLMGHVVFVAPVLFLGAGAALALDWRRATSSQMLWGVAGILVMLFGWVHLVTTEHGAVFDTTAARFGALFHRDGDRALLERPDGGILGGVVMSALFLLGRTGSFVTLAAIGLASLLLLTELTLRGIMERVHERSRIAAERTRARAAAVGERCREVASALPVRRKQDLFLDVDEPGEEEEAPAPAPVRRSLRRVPRAEQPAPLPGLVEPVEETALVPAARPEPEPEPPAVTEAARQVPPRAEKPRPRAARPPRAAAAAGGEYQLPPLDLLDAPAARPKRVSSEADGNISILESTLAQFRIEAQVVEIADGPSVTRYEIRLGEGIRVKKILDLADNIAMSLAAMSVRVEAPIPGKAAIGIEVPKKHTRVVTLRECLESDEARDIQSKVGFVLGRDVGDNVRCADLARMPHLLVAGATNSGKSVCLNVLIASMLFRARPDELKMIMIDPKRVELTLFDGIPHLIHPVVKDVKQAAGILRWVLKEMDRRYDLFAHLMTRNIEGYNEKVAAEPQKRLPYLVVVVDELADLMMQQGPEIEQAICRLAQLARATGIHLVIATQRPSVDVITGLIKANVPSRIAFSVSAQVDSRTILDGKGAENLIGRGDMLFKPVDASKPTRIQGAFLKEAEVERLVAFLKTQGSPEYIAEALAVDHGAYGSASEEEAEDELFEPAARFVVTTGHASTSMIQRKFKIGYTRAARLVDMMESRGIVGALDGAKPREIMMSRDSVDQMFRDTRNSLNRDAYADAEEEDEDEVEVELDSTSAGDDPFVEE